MSAVLRTACNVNRVTALKCMEIRQWRGHKRGRTMWKPSLALQCDAQSQKSSGANVTGSMFTNDRVTSSTASLLVFHLQSAWLARMPQITTMSASNPPSSTAKRGHRRLRPRCRRCIKLRRNCNGQKPKCDICKTTVDCVWPEGNPSRRELEEREAAELEQNQSQSEYQDSSLVSAGTSSDPTVGESGISAAKNEGAAVKRKRDGAQITTTVQMHDGSGLIGSPAEPARRTRNTASRGGRGRSRGGTSRARGGGTGLAPRSSTPTPSSTAQSESIPMYQNSSEILGKFLSLFFCRPICLSVSSGGIDGTMEGTAEKKRSARRGNLPEEGDVQYATG